MTINELNLKQIVKYRDYIFRVTGIRSPDIVYLKPIGITKKVYRGEIQANIKDIRVNNFDGGLQKQV